MDPLDLSFSDQLKSLRKELASKNDPAIAYFQPTRIHYYGYVLAPLGFEMSDIIVNHYIGEDWDWPYLEEESATYIRHGHERYVTPGRNFCTNRTYCHISTYRPTGAEAPIFIKHFNEKWGYDKPRPSTEGLKYGYGQLTITGLSFD